MLIRLRCVSDGSNFYMSLRMSDTVSNSYHIRILVKSLMGMPDSPCKSKLAAITHPG